MGWVGMERLWLLHKMVLRTEEQLLTLVETI
jgi:hypothetical protein